MLDCLVKEGQRDGSILSADACCLGIEPELERSESCCLCVGQLREIPGRFLQSRVFIRAESVIALQENDCFEDPEEDRIEKA